jgi:hypothetical protein
MNRLKEASATVLKKYGKGLIDSSQSFLLMDK